MVDKEKVKDDPLEKENRLDKVERNSISGAISNAEGRLDEITVRPRRGRLLHWLAFVLSLVSLSLPIIWLIKPIWTQSGFDWLWLDLGMSVFFGFEFFTRSGFRWNHSRYVRTHGFEFIAIVPVLVLTHYGVVYEQAWVWLILVARFGRALDRLWGDGFVERNILALVEGFEEEITDRVMLRIMVRIQDDLDRGQFGHGLADALAKNKEPVLQRIRGEHPQHGMGAEIARFVGLEAAVGRAEEHIYDSIVEVLGSAAIDQAIRESVDSAFSVMRHQIAVKSWKKGLGVKPSDEAGGAAIKDHKDSQIN
jgi:hypothetical protein